MNPTINAPKRFRRIIDRCMDADRRYFVTHPGLESYVRPYVYGELWPHKGDFDAVEVVQVSEGVRIRRPITVKRTDIASRLGLD
jgi:hypothetical protein